MKKFSHKEMTEFMLDVSAFALKSVFDSIYVESTESELKELAYEVFQEYCAETGFIPNFEGTIFEEERPE